jgi:phosphatidylglycerol:prolipoprotein diacylglycerol transferase
MIQIGPIAVRWYGFLIASGVLVGALWAMRFAERRDLDPDRLLDMAPYLVVAGIIGARLVYVVTSPTAFFGPGGNPIDAFKIWQGGVSFHGSVLGILLALWIYGRVHKLNMWSYLDLMTPLAALGIIGGRIGNFMNGTDTGGRLTEWQIGFTWPEVGTETLGAFGRLVFGDPLWRFGPPICTTLPAGEPCTVHLAPLYGVLIGIGLVFITVWALRRSAVPGFAFWQFVLWYSILRSMLEEPFRDNPLFWTVYLNDGAGIGFFTLTQIASVPIILIALYLLLIMDPDKEVRRERISSRARGR